MHKTIRGAAVALGALALTATAAAQEAENQQQAEAQQQAESPQAPQDQQAPADQQQPPNQQQQGSPPEAENQYVSNDPIFFASLDIAGSGNFTGVLDPATNELCYILNAAGVDQPTAAHIHAGGPDESGPPVVPLENPEDGASGACTAIEPDVAQAMVANPGGYYINVHNAAYPDGVVRAQLKG